MPSGKKWGVDYNAPVTLTFIFICGAELVANRISGDILTLNLFSCFRTSLLDPLQYLRLFTHVFGHTGIDHFLGNALILLITAPMIEEKYGSRDVFYMILITTLITGLSHIIFFGDTLLLGASGICFMFILLSSFANLGRHRIPMTFIFVLVLYLGREIVSMVTIDDNVSRITHILGGICGALFGFFVKTSKKSVSRRQDAR